MNVRISSELCHVHSLERQHPLPCIVVQTKILPGILSTCIRCFDTFINEQTRLKQAKKENSQYQNEIYTTHCIQYRY